MTNVYSTVATWIAHAYNTVGGWLAMICVVAAVVWVVRLEGRVRRLESGSHKQPKS